MYGVSAFAVCVCKVVGAEMLAVGESYSQFHFSYHLLSNIDPCYF